MLSHPPRLISLVHTVYGTLLASLRQLPPTCSYYGHDHGTAPQFQSVPPRFGYTAWKNGRQDESHIGFKGYGFWSGPDKYYITSHIDTTLVRRVRERFHTVTLAATSPSGETVADLSCKGDFGAFDGYTLCCVGSGLNVDALEPRSFLFEFGNEERGGVQPFSCS